MTDVKAERDDPRTATSKLWNEVYVEATRRGEPQPIASEDADHAVAALESILRFKRAEPEPR